MWWTSAYQRPRSVGRFRAPRQISTDFALWRRYCTDVAQRRSTKLCRMFDRLLGWYTIYTFSGALAPNGILPDAKFTLSPSRAFSYIGSVTARHSSSDRQPNWGVQHRGRQLYSAGRPSHWASTHILVKAAISNRAGHYIFPVVSFFFVSSFFFPRHTSTHGVALVQI